MDPILDEIDKALKRKGLSAAAASKEAAGHYSLIKNMKASKAGGKRYSVETLEKLAEVLDLQLYFGPKLPGFESEPFRIARMIQDQYGDVLEVADNAEQIAAEFYANNPDAIEPSREFELDGQKFATVARHDANAAAGGGYVNFDEEPIDHLAFSSTWLQQNGIQAGSCSLINAFGKSMEPSIWDGDLIMIDHRKKEISNRRIYVYNDPDNGTRVKRLELSDDVIAVHSDNPDKQEFPTEYHTGATMNAVSQNIVGQVVWSGHKWA